MTRNVMTRNVMTRNVMTRKARAIAVSAVCVVMATLLSGCGGAQGLLGIHEAPTAQATTPPLTVENAQRILTRVFTAAYRGESASGAAARVAQDTAYTGQALRAVRARVKLASVRPAVADPSLVAPPQPRLLAVSRDLSFPRFIVAQTVLPKGGLPAMHLLISPDAATPYRISVSAEMMPRAEVKPFDALGKGSSLVIDGADLVVAPPALLNLYAARMAFPTKPMTTLPFAEDTFSEQVRGRAAGLAQDVATQATYSQVHKVINGSTYAVRQASGDALVFGVLERTDSFAVKPGQALNTVANKEFVFLTGKEKVNQKASITTLELVAFVVPRSKEQATLVAARDQVVAGSGS